MYINEINDLHRSAIMIKYINETDTKWTPYFCSKVPMDSLGKFEKNL